MIRFFAVTLYSYRRALTYSILSLALSLASANNAAAAEPVAISFDSLYPGTIVTNQYPGAVFSAMGFSGGVGTGPYDYNIYVISSRYRSYPQSVSSSNVNNDMGGLYVDFPIPVNNLKFYALNIYDAYYAAGYVAI